MLDGDNRLVFVNDRYKDMTQLPNDRYWVGRPMLEILVELAAAGFYGDGDPQELAQQRFQQVYGSQVNVQTEMQLPDGRTIEFRKSPIGLVAVS